MAPVPPIRKIFFEGVRIGDELPAMTKPPIERVQLARYAGATGDFNPMWVDEVFAKAAGMPTVMAPPGLAMGFLGQLVTDWGKGGQLKKFSARFSRMLWPSDTLVCKGRIFDRHGHNGHYYLELELWAENQRGELAAKGHATLKVFYSPEDEQRFRAGQPPVVVNVNRSSLLVASPTAPNTKRATSSAKPPTPSKPDGTKLVSRKAAKPAKSAKPAPKASKPSPKSRPKPAKALAKKKKR